jgi:hypothetical protein
MIATENSSLNFEDHAPAGLVSRDEELGQGQKPLGRVSFMVLKGHRSASQLNGSSPLRNQGITPGYSQPRKSASRTRLSVEDHSSTWHLDIETGNIHQDLMSETKDGLYKEDSTCPHCYGVRGVTKQIEKAGGDFPSRLDEALRASLGT